MEANVLRVLLVEDSPSDQFLIREHLYDPEITFEVTRAKRLASALRKLATDRFDCVILDLHLPDGEGVDVIRSVTQAAHESAVVVMTGEINSPLSLLALRHGAQDFLAKDDVALQTIARVVRFAVQRKRIEQRIESSERRLALVARASYDTIWDWDVQRDSLYRSPSWFRMLGLTPTPFFAQLEEWIERLHPDDRDAFRQRLESGEADEQGVAAVHYRMRDSQDTYRAMYARWVVVKSHGLVTRCVGFQLDVERTWKLDR